MKRILVLALAALSVMVAVPLASADQRQHLVGSAPNLAGDRLELDTTACPDFVTPQPYGIHWGRNFRMDASWKIGYVDAGGFWTDMRGKMRGDGVDLNTGLTYSLAGDFDSATSPGYDILGPGEFTIKRSDGAEMAFTSAFQWGGAGAPALYPTDVACTPPKHT